MQKKKNRVVRDPYYHWKIMNMVLACAILILAVLVLCGREAKYLAPAACCLGVLMCALSGIMELAKSKRVTGYLCSVFSGILAVALIFDLIRSWFL